MRKLLLVLIIGLLATSAAFADAKDRPRCELCNMFWDISATRVEAGYSGGTHKFESMGCLFQSVDSKSDLTSIKVLDYSTASRKTPKMIDGKSAHYLYGTSKLKGSMAPFVAAFASKDAATKAKADLGGEYVTFDGLWKKLDSTLKKRVAVKGETCSCGDPNCKGCAKGKSGGCSCPECAGK
jgi:nitrous oxide reductase accessory protein NosL